jgi:hypothetical protein
MKILTKNNWQEMDPTCDNFLFLDHDTGNSGPLFPDQWVDTMFATQLHEVVPDDIKELFEVARATMLYGYFYYPLFNLGLEQFHRVAEAALSKIYQTQNGPETTRNGRFPTLFFKISWLKENGHMSDEDFKEWDWVREARNIGSHLVALKLYPPIPATMALEETANRINRLFQ